MKNPPLIVPKGAEHWRWVTTAESFRRLHRLSRVITGREGERGDDVLADWYAESVLGVTVCGFDGELTGGSVDLSGIRRCRTCCDMLGIAGGDGPMDEDGAGGGA
ncbi:MAG: hypothetical protein ABI780_01825 [Ardenticatenales bacterium]